MQKCTLKINNTKGLHARAAAKLSNLVADFQSLVTITYKNRSVQADSVIQLMLLAAPCNGIIKLTVKGEDEVPAFRAITELINSGFEEN